MCVEFMAWEGQPNALPLTRRSILASAFPKKYGHIYENELEEDKD